MLIYKALYPSTKSEYLHSRLAVNVIVQSSLLRAPKVIMFAVVIVNKLMKTLLDMHALVYNGVNYNYQCAIWLMPQ